jgi:hypothetical protein
VLGVRKFGDMDKYKPYGNQITHFVNQMESPNGTKSTWKWKKCMYHILNMTSDMHIIGKWRKKHK